MASSFLRWPLGVLGVSLGFVLSPVAQGQTPTPSPQKVAFVGVWDRSMAIVDAACREHDLSAGFYTAGGFASRPAEESYPLVLVLNVDAAESLALTERLDESGTLPSGGQTRVLALDTRSSHADLDKAGLLERDPKVMSYWRANGPVNLRRLMQYLKVTYLGGPGSIEPPVIIPEYGYYDPEHEEAFEEFTRYTAFKKSRGRWRDGAPHAVMMIQQSFWITRDLKVVDAQIAALEKEGLNVAVIFGDREGRMTDLVRAARPTLLIEDRHGSMWQSNALLKELDVPCLRPISMLGYTVDDWRKDPRGLSIRDVGMFMSLQESWGTIEPVVVGGLYANIQGFRLHEPIPDRIQAFAARAARWAQLKTKPPAEKKLAIIYYNKGLGQDDLMRGSPTGAFLDGPESLVRFLPRLKEAGYTVDQAPGTAAELVAQMKRKGRNLGPWAQGDLEKLVDEGSPVLVPLATYERWFQEKLSDAGRRAVVEKFGPPPGRLMVVHRNGTPCLVIPRIALGNILLTPQPERGEKQDDKLLHSRDIPPPHNYLAFYWWLEEEYQADAVVHWGTHGTLELLPGKEAGMSRDCWSDICVGRLPVVDLWITDNLGEATLARRRSYAVLVDHMVPPAVGAGLEEGHKNLHDDIHKFNTLEPGLLREEFRKRITTQVREQSFHHLARAPDGAAPYPDTSIARVDQHLHELYDSQTPVRLHILGQRPVAEDMAPYLVNILGDPFVDHLADASPFFKNLAVEKSAHKDAAVRVLDAALQGLDAPSFPVSEALEKDLSFAKEMKGRLEQADREITGLIHALDGGYIEAGPGPEPVRNPATVPTGRNLYSLNPEEIPNQAAWEVAKKLVDDLLRTRQPKKIGMDLNGMETMRDFGVMEGQILYLLGVRPLWNRSNLVVDVELIPAEELKRPRVDVFIAMGGQYKENFPTRVKLLDKAVRLAAAAPEDQNPVRESVRTMESRLQKRGFSTARAAEFATARIFGTKPGNLTGTNILHLVPRSGIWDTTEEITSVYMDNMSFAYTGDVWGEQIDGLYEEAIQGTDTILRVWASNMTSQLSNHHAYEYLGGLNLAVTKVTGKTPQALIADVRHASGGRVRDFEEVLAANLGSELLNKKWLQGMKGHDYAGAGHIAELVKNSFGWSATREGSISQETWTDIYEVIVKDRHDLGLQAWLEKVSPHARQEITATLLEAARKSLWHATAEQVADLARIHAESVSRHGESGGLTGGGNTRLADYTEATLTATGDAGDLTKAVSMRAASAGGDAGNKEKVLGPELEPADALQPAGTGPRDYWKYGVAALVLLLLGAGFYRRAGAV